ncbi:MAG: hypothetical protein HJJLKODD_01495 [Phycisphaerae bacterium]|nr:hypothetical protein [Phycisphaerae bacterium]
MIRYRSMLVILITGFTLLPELSHSSSPPTSATPEVVRYNFDQDSSGQLSVGWKIEGTNQEGPLATWQVQADESAPSKPQVLTLTDAKEGASGTFNLCWTEQQKFENGRIEVSFKALTGKEDQGGGPIWRVIDKDNYYICRANPLEHNFRVYYVKDAKRKMLASAEVDIPTGEWQKIVIEQAGKKITCYLNDKKLLEVEDETFTQPGGIGLWTKADAATAFDDLIIAPITVAPEN